MVRVAVQKLPSRIGLLGQSPLPRAPPNAPPSPAPLSAAAWPWAYSCLVLTSGQCVCVPGLTRIGHWTGPTSPGVSSLQPLAPAGTGGAHPWVLGRRVPREGTIQPRACHGEHTVSTARHQLSFVGLSDGRKREPGAAVETRGQGLFPRIQQEPASQVWMVGEPQVSPWEEPSGAGPRPSPSTRVCSEDTSHSGTGWLLAVNPGAGPALASVRSDMRSPTGLSGLCSRPVPAAGRWGDCCCLASASLPARPRHARQTSPRQAATARRLQTAPRPVQVRPTSSPDRPAPRARGHSACPRPPRPPQCVAAGGWAETPARQLPPRCPWALRSLCCP